MSSHLCCFINTHAHTHTHTQFDTPDDAPNVRQYCIRVPEDCEPFIHNCHFTNTSFCGSCVYVHGRGSRPHFSHCTIANANNVGIFVDDHAQVLCLSVSLYMYVLCLFVCLSVTTGIMSICLSIFLLYMSVCTLSLCTCLSVCLSVCLFYGSELKK